LKDDGENGPPCVPEAAILVAGVTCSGGGLTVSVAVRAWVPRLLSKLVKVIVEEYAPTAKLFAFAFTVKVTAVPEDDTLPEVEEEVSQFGTPDIE
jgi:hypothetical protein